MHMKKKLLAFGMAVLMLTGCGSSSGTIRFGAAGLGGTYHMFSDAFAEIIESESADCSIEVKTTAGSAANVRLLSDGYVQMAIAQADIINAPVNRPRCVETTAMGAAYLAGLAVGYWENKEDVKNNVSYDRVFTPEMGEEERATKRKGWNKAVKYAFGWAKDEEEEE